MGVRFMGGGVLSFSRGFHGQFGSYELVKI